MQVVSVKHSSVGLIDDVPFLVLPTKNVEPFPFLRPSPPVNGGVASAFCLQVVSVKQF